MDRSPSSTSGKIRTIAVVDCLRDAKQRFVDGKHEQSAKLSAQIYGDALASEDFELCAAAALLAAKSQFNQNKFDECITWARRAEHAARQIGHKEDVALATVLLASAMASSDDHEAAIKLAFQALQLLPDDATVYTKLSVFTGVGITYASLGLSRHALDIFIRAKLTADRAQISPAERCRYSQNYIEGLLEYYEVVAPVNALEAEHMRAEAKLLCDRLRRDAMEAKLPYFDRAAQRLELCWGMVVPHDDSVAQALHAFVARSDDDDKSDELKALLLLAHDAHQREEFANARVFAQRAESLQRNHLARSGRARLMRNEMKFALYSGNETRALALREKYFCFVLRNEHAAFDARMDELNVAISSQAMQVQIVELQSQNVGLTKHFDALSEQAHTDALTQLFNRRGIEKRFEQLCAENAVFCVAMIDIDHFKKVNDQFSHVVGDEVLRQVAHLMKQSLRDHDVLGRFGGEEFLAFIRTPDLDEAHQISERLRANIQDFAWSNVCNGLSITVCVGVCWHSSDELLIDVVRRVDSLMYAAKNSGRNAVISGE